MRYISSISRAIQLMTKVTKKVVVRRGFRGQSEEEMEEEEEEEEVL